MFVPCDYARATTVGCCSAASLGGKTNSIHSPSSGSNFTTCTYRVTQLPRCSLQTPVIPVNEGLRPSRRPIAVYKFRHMKDTHMHTHAHTQSCHLSRLMEACCCDTREAELHLSEQECGVMPFRGELMEP